METSSPARLSKLPAIIRELDDAELALIVKQVVAEEVAESSFAVVLVAPCIVDSALRFPLSVELEGVDELIAALEPEQAENEPLSFAICLSDSACVPNRVLAVVPDESVFLFVPHVGPPYTACGNTSGVALRLSKSA